MDFPATQNDTFQMKHHLQILVGPFVASCFISPAALGACKFIRIAGVSEKEGTGIVYKSEKFNWVVTALNDSEVSILDRKSKSVCKIPVDNMNQVYQGGGSEVVLESAQIASDTLFFVDARSCKDARKSISVEFLSKAKRSKQFRSLGICE